MSSLYVMADYDVLKKRKENNKKNFSLIKNVSRIYLYISYISSFDFVRQNKGEENYLSYLKQ